MIASVIPRTITDELFEPSTQGNKVRHAVVMAAVLAYPAYELVGYLVSASMSLSLSLLTILAVGVTGAYMGMRMAKWRHLVVPSSLMLAPFLAIDAYILVEDAAFRNQVPRLALLGSPELLVAAAPNLAVAFLCVAALGIPVTATVSMFAGQSLRQAWMARPSKEKALSRTLAAFVLVSLASGTAVFFHQQIGHRGAELLRMFNHVVATEQMLETMKKANPGANLDEAEFMLVRQAADFLGVAHQPQYKSSESFKAYMSERKAKEASKG